MWFRKKLARFAILGCGFAIILVNPPGILADQDSSAKFEPSMVFKKPAQPTGWCRGALMTLSFPAIQRVQHWLDLPKTQDLFFDRVGILFFPVHPDGESTTSVQFALRDSDTDKSWVYKVRGRIKRLKELDQRIRVAHRSSQYRFYHFQIGVTQAEYQNIVELFSKTNVFTGPTCASGLCRSLGTALPDLFFLHRFPESLKRKIPALRRHLSTFDNVPSMMYLPPSITAAYLMILQKTLHPRLGDIHYFGPSDSGIGSPQLWKELALISTAPISVPLWWLWNFKLKSWFSSETTKEPGSF